MPGKKPKIYSGYNFRVVDIPGFDKVTFGCPPGIVKDFSRRKKELTTHYILPTRTLVKGKNNFDFEFIVYSFLFIRPEKDKIQIYCTDEQERRFRAILKETLFGPTFPQLVQAQFRKFGLRHFKDEKDHNRYQKFVETVGKDSKLYKLFSNQLKEHLSQADLMQSLVEYFSKLVNKTQWLSRKKISGVARSLANNYYWVAQLHKEMEIFSMIPNKGRDEFIENVVEFNIFNKKNSVTLKSINGSKRKIRVIQKQPSEFEIVEGKQSLLTVDMVALDTPPRPSQVDLLDKPILGVTFLGVGSGFSHERKNSCVVVWSEGKGIMVDAFSDHNESVLEHGITEDDISYMFLSHVHSDHDSGFIEKVLSGQRIKVISTRIIFESFLRKIAAITLFPIKVVEGFIDFLEIEPQKKIKLPGFERTWLEFDYSLHSIPAGRFRLTYKDEKGKEHVISHSGDTKYDKTLIRGWYEQGSLSRKRFKDILGFIWDSDCIIHEVGGGQLHTEFAALADLPDSVARKMHLVHQHKDPLDIKCFNYALEGETFTILPGRKSKSKSPIELLKKIHLFSEVKQGTLRSMLKKSKVVECRQGETVFSKNDVGDSFYVILDGFAEILLGRDLNAIYERGMFFGELAIATDNPLRRATVRAISNLKLLKIPKKVYLDAGVPEIMDDFYNLDNHFNEVVRPGLVASLGFGSLTHWNKDQKIFPNGKSNGEVYIILSGEVKLKGPSRKNIAFLSSGDIMGEIPDWSAITGKTVAQAHSDEVYAICLEQNQVNRLFKLYPSFHGTVYQKMKKLANRLT